MSLFNRFEEAYHLVRSKEQRLYTDEEVKRLPFIEGESPYSYEWKMRVDTLRILKKYLISLRRPLEMLDVGCGNGWMTNALSEIPNSTITGIDLHKVEVEQAIRVFGNNAHLEFIYGNLFDYHFGEKKFDVIIIAGSAAYFKNFSELISHLLSLLNPGGELHLVDNPFYKTSTLQIAKERSREYFIQLDASEMADFYYHYTWDDLQEFSFVIKNGSFINKLSDKLLNRARSPFPWVCIRHK